MTPHSKTSTPSANTDAPEVRTSMVLPSKAPPPGPDAGAPEERTSMAVLSRAPTSIPTRGTSESRCTSTAPSNNAPMPGPSSSISDSSISESGSRTNSNMLREGKAKAKKLVPMCSGKVKAIKNLYVINYLKDHSVTREEFVKVWVNLDEATKKIYKQWKMDAKSTAESNLV
ncbi:hypothetical protein EI94DRAFT_1798348 [Lactarius quietus]|nr:hypothetical protein EI94DRAFT_1798348 [Lactarius quietus]